MLVNILIYLLGLCAGSFINCLENRIINHQSILGRSKCDNCSHVLNIKDLIPIVSWIILKGKCRYCGKSISIRYPISEIICGIGFELIFIKYGFTYLTLLYLILFSCLFYISLFDLDTFEIPELALVISLIIYILLSYLNKNFIAFIHAFIIASTIYLLSLLMKKILKKDCFGFGDIKLIFIIGLFLGLYKTIWCLLLACIIGIIMILINKKEIIPFGPPLCFSCIVLLLI